MHPLRSDHMIIFLFSHLDGLENGEFWHVNICNVVISHCNSPGRMIGKLSFDFPSISRYVMIKHYMDCVESLSWKRTR